MRQNASVFRIAHKTSDIYRPLSHGFLLLYLDILHDTVTFLRILVEQCICRAVVYITQLIHNCTNIHKKM